MMVLVYQWFDASGDVYMTAQTDDGEVEIVVKFDGSLAADVLEARLADLVRSLYLMAHGEVENG